MRSIAKFLALALPAGVALVFNASLGAPKWAVLVAFLTTLIAGGMVVHYDGQRENDRRQHLREILWESKRTTFAALYLDEILQGIYRLIQGPEYWTREETAASALTGYQLWRMEFIDGNDEMDYVIDTLMQGMLPKTTKLPDTVTLQQYEDLFRHWKERLYN